MAGYPANIIVSGVARDVVVLRSTVLKYTQKE
jgi:hypothetical protein